jgi:decaprenylphospho-beta-D-ribofuranose 2-oxidase
VVTRAPARLLHGWGRTAPTLAQLAAPEGDLDVVAAVHEATEGRGLIARGLGRSYGDAAQNAGGLALDMTARTRLLDVDADTGVVAVEAGISLDALLRAMVPKGWFVPVTPGTRHVTVGGAIAADIHGKNHHLAGSFCQHVRWFDLVDGRGETHRVTPASDPDLFWGTAGGMGLTGVLLRAGVRLLPVTTSYATVDTERARDLDDLLARLAADDGRYPYSVSWIDLVARGGRLGRGVITRGWHATREQLPARLREDPLRFRPATRLRVPAHVPVNLLGRAGVAAFNEAWFRRAPRLRRGEIQPLASFFHPLDGVADWNRAYGPRGFVQYQLVVPPAAVGELREVVRRVAGAGQASFLAVLKRFGPGNPGPLSFPTEGWTLALDLPTGAAGLTALLDGLDELVLGAGGRIYLAKDSRLSARSLAAMYPGLARFRALRERVDPRGVFRSDLARRLELC